MKQFETLQKIIQKDKNKYTLKEIMKVFAITMEGYERKSQTVKSIKSKITEGEWNSLINGITMSLFMSLYASNAPIEKALKLVNVEGVVGVIAVEEKDEKIN